jgi:cobalt-zinc-cadmium efflux system membrane fusion protein
MKNILIYAFLVILFAGCTPEQNEQENASSEYIEITEEQFQSENMKIGSPEKTVMEERIKFTGQIVSKADGLAKISAPIAGIVTKISGYTGQNVNSGSLILSVGGNSLIELQQEFAESSAKIGKLKADFERNEKLFKENIATESEFLTAESEYKTEMARNRALALKLELIGCDIAAVKSGKYILEYKVKSPIAGQISQLNATIGQYVSSETEIAEVVNKAKSELQLTFYESDFPKIKQGQKVIFAGLNSDEFSAHGAITRIGSKLTENSNTLEGFASISEESKANFAVNRPIHGEVIISSDTVTAIPATALIEQDKSYYIIKLAKKSGSTYSFEKHKVKLGKVNKINAELLDFDSNAVILINGLENILVE